MNKRRVDGMIPLAYEVLKEVQIVEKDGTIDKSYRGQISSFGAAVAMGSLLSAVSYFSQQNRAAVDRSKLMTAIHMLMNKENGRGGDEKSDPLALFNYVRKDSGMAAKELILDCAVALKLAMNLYNLK